MPSLEEFEKRLKKQRELRKSQIEAATNGDEEVDEIAPFVLAALEDLKQAKSKAVPIRKLMTTMKHAGLELPKSDYNRVRKIIANTFGLEITQPYPTIFQMPYRLPVMKDGKVTELAILIDPDGGGAVGE